LLLDTDTVKTPVTVPCGGESEGLEDALCVSAALKEAEGVGAPVSVLSRAGEAVAGALAEAAKVEIDEGVGLRGVRVACRLACEVAEGKGDAVAVEKEAVGGAVALSPPEALEAAELVRREVAEVLAKESVALALSVAPCGASEGVPVCVPLGALGVEVGLAGPVLGLPGEEADCKGVEVAEPPVALTVVSEEEAREGESRAVKVTWPPEGVEKALTVCALEGAAEGVGRAVRVATPPTPPGLPVA
jgi:hypothetical protein